MLKYVGKSNQLNSSSASGARHSPGVSPALGCRRGPGSRCPSRSSLSMGVSMRETVGKYAKMLENVGKRGETSENIGKYVKISETELWENMWETVGKSVGNCWKIWCYPARIEDFTGKTQAFQGPKWRYHQQEISPVDKNVFINMCSSAKMRFQQQEHNIEIVNNHGTVTRIPTLNLNLCIYHPKHVHLNTKDWNLAAKNSDLSNKHGNVIEKWDFKHQRPGSNLQNPTKTGDGSSQGALPPGIHLGASARCETQRSAEEWD